jgi:hypothetical protein
MAPLRPNPNITMREGGRKEVERERQKERERKKERW